MAKLLRCPDIADDKLVLIAVEQFTEGGAFEFAAVCENTTRQRGLDEPCPVFRFALRLEGAALRGEAFAADGDLILIVTAFDDAILPTPCCWSQVWRR